MSDCVNGGRNAYQVARLRIEFAGDEVPWMYPLALNGREIEGVYVDGERYVPEKNYKMLCGAFDALRKLVKDGKATNR